MLRIVLLLDSLEVSAWVWEAIYQTMKVERTQIVLAVVNESPKPSGKKSPFIYRFYRWADRKLFLKQPDAFAKKNLKSIPHWKVPELRGKPIQKKYSDYFNSETLAKIKSYQPDLIIRFGFRILRGEILNIAPLGVWSYHHGDPSCFRGGPPCFWEVMKQEETTGVVLQKLNEKLDDGVILYQSWSQTDPLSVQRNANKVFWKSSYFIARVLKQINLEGLESWKKNLGKKEIYLKEKGPILTPPTTSEMLGLWFDLWKRNSLRKNQENSRKPHWEIKVAARKPFQNPLEPNFDFQSVLPPKNDHKKGDFWADPFPVEKGEETWVFYEEFDAKKNKGRICVGKWDGKSLIDRTVALEENWHLSYPFIWEENGSFYLIPESGEADNLFIYEAVDFPYTWKNLGLFFQGEAFDPTIIKTDEGYWLFVNQRPHTGASPFVELNAYFSKSLLKPQWEAHAANPIVSDVRSSRPAGRIFEWEGKLYRPAQDSGKRYGHRIKIQEIQELTLKSYLEKTVRILEPEEAALGTHTFNFSSHWIFSDSYFRR
ncbi:glucosamine inositolphosphorylceramide transferase family protein [Algoriphagus limi]|uniref:Formyl transferase N-terminal domain-containing protein n=1 Tax=Algoriphagus limi TaxID=2975273 RepID=A0ABT2G180_9BACT|nr:formyltransferase family protein [Algoriphagus limi]MCS5489031.1 hypothetical protein [Algoriphagus limi]